MHIDAQTDSGFFFEQSEIQTEAQATKSIASEVNHVTQEDVLLIGVVQGEGVEELLRYLEPELTSQLL